MKNHIASAYFHSGMDVISLVNHTPEVQAGDRVRIVRPRHGNLCAVQLPDGMIHRWFASFELTPEKCCQNGSPVAGSLATVTNVTGHGSPPHIPVGTTVKVIRCIPTTFYDVTLNNGEYHRWLADFELASPV